MKALKNFTILFFLFSFFTIACSKEPDPKPNPGGNNSNDTTKTTIEYPIDLIWQTPLAPSLELGNSDFAYLAGEDKVIYSTLFANSYEGLFACNRITGEKLWDWDMNGITRIHSHHDIVADNKYLFLKDTSAVYKVDLETGRTLWESPSRGSNRNIVKIGNFLYTSGAKFNNGYPINWLYRTHAETGKREVLFEIKTVDNDSLEPHLVAGAPFVLPNSDTLVLFVTRNIQLGTWKRRVDLYAYNLNERTIEWVNQEACPKGIGTRHVPIIYDDLIYLKGSEHVMCFDPEDGSKIWEVGPMSGNAHVPLLFAEGKLFVNPDGRELMALDPKTGQTIWKLGEDKGPASAQSMVYYDGKLYTNGVTGLTSKLHCFDPSNGELIWSMRSPNLDDFPSVGYSNGDGGMSLDPELEYLYITDGHFNQCFDLTPE